MIKKHNLTKKYRAILQGNYPIDEDTIESPIGRHKTQPHKMCVDPEGKPSKTNSAHTPPPLIYNSYLFFPWKTLQRVV